MSSYTTLLHGGLSADPTHGALVEPICQSTTFKQDAVGSDRGFTYSRSGNPTVAALERNLAAIEGVEAPAAAFATGMAAISAICLAELSAGDHVVVGSVVYGGTVRLLRQVLGRFGVQASFVDSTDLEAVDEAVTTRTKLVFVETPANPTLVLTDIAGVAEIAHRKGARLVVDNTFLTPALQQCVPLGADLVVYSTTKYIEGHNTTVGGAVLAADPAGMDSIRFVQNAIGFAQSPFQAWLTLRGLKTLPLRMERHCQNAEIIAQWLSEHPQVAAVHYPGLPTFPQAALAERQQKRGGGMVAFELRGGVQAAVDALARVELCVLAENLGAVQTLVTHPATMTHADVPAEARRAAGITDGLIRLSVGLEDPEHLIADLDQAFCGGAR
jgi:cystathionine beta-lyase/cystathionine gamma-synthase